VNWLPHKGLGPRNSLLQMAMGVVPEMGVNNAQRSVSSFSFSAVEINKACAWSSHLVDKGNDVLFLNYEGVVV